MFLFIGHLFLLICNFAMVWLMDLVDITLGIYLNFVAIRNAMSILCQDVQCTCHT
jgi:hypothetical protein